MLYDHLDRPIKSNQLTKDIAFPSIAGVRNVWQTSVANALTPTTLANILLQVDQGDTLSYLTLAEEMEERDMHYASVLSVRKLTVTGLPTMVEAVSDDTKDVEIADSVRNFVETDTFDSMLPAAIDAIGKSYSVVEIMWDRSGKQWTPASYKWRDPRFFQFDLETGDEIRLRDEQDLVNGIPLEPFKFIVHRPRLKMGLTIRGGLARPVCVGYMLKGYSLKDWWAFMEVFGMPWRVGKYSASASDKQKEELLSALRQMGVDAACIISENMIVDIIEASKTSGGDKLFSGSADWIDKQISKLVLGQTASAEGTPGKLGNEKLQSDVRDDIRKADAKQLSATIRRDLVKPFVDLNFGPQERYPKFRLVIDEPEDLVALSESLPEFIDRGLRVQASVILDKFGLPEAEDGAEILQSLKGVVPKTEGEQEEESTEEPEEESLEKEQRKTVIELFKRVRRGEQISAEDRQLLVASMAMVVMQAKKDHKDEIDKLVDSEVDNWRAVMDPVFAPVLALAEKSDSFESFLSKLEETLANVDTTEFMERLAISTAKARGLGDATDDI